MTNTTKKTQPNDPSRGRLLRSPSERMLVGVAGGTAKFLGVDPTLVRLGFVVAAFFGGAGLLAYLVMAVVVPADDGTGNPVEGRLGEDTVTRLVRVAAIGLVVILALGAAVSVAALAAFATATGNGAIVAGTVIALGIGLAATAFVGDGAKRAAPWLLAVALILAIPSGAVAAADVRFDGGVGERSYSPASATDIPDDGYELGVGQMTIDLRELDVPAGQSVTMPAKLGLGQLIVSVPSGTCVTGHAEAKGGELLVRGESNSGASPEFDRGPAPGSTLPQVEIDAELQFGQLVVTDRDPDEFAGDRGPRNGEGQPDELTAEPAACAG